MRGRRRQRQEERDGEWIGKAGYERGRQIWRLGECDPGNTGQELPADGGDSTDEAKDQRNHN